MGAEAVRDVEGAGFSKEKELGAGADEGVEVGSGAEDGEEAGSSAGTDSGVSTVTTAAEATGIESGIIWDRRRGNIGLERYSRYDRMNDACLIIASPIIHFRTTTNDCSTPPPLGP